MGTRTVGDKASKAVWITSSDVYIESSFCCHSPFFSTRERICFMIKCLLMRDQERTIAAESFEFKGHLQVWRGLNEWLVKRSGTHPKDVLVYTSDLDHQGHHPVSFEFIEFEVFCDYYNFATTIIALKTYWIIWTKSAYFTLHLLAPLAKVAKWWHHTHSCISLPTATASTTWTTPSASPHLKKFLESSDPFSWCAEHATSVIKFWLSSYMIRFSAKL